MTAPNLGDVVTVCDNMYPQDFDTMKEFLIFVGEQRQAGHSVDTWVSEDRKIFRAWVKTNPRQVRVDHLRKENR